MSDHKYDPGLPDGLTDVPHSPRSDDGLRGSRQGQAYPGNWFPTPARSSSVPPTVSVERLYRSSHGLVAPHQAPSAAFLSLPTSEDSYSSLHQSSRNAESVSPGGQLSRGRDSPLPSGYEYKFEPELDPKHECPICLMCLRDPVQTECGHRFCADCIRHCLRVTSLRCPVDNVALTESQMFPDICVKREIMDLQAHCPFKDCPELVELRNIDNHREVCEFRTEPCPNLCGASMRRKSITNHLESSCPKRLVECEFCQMDIAFDDKQNHILQCPERPMSCQFCKFRVLACDLGIHHDTACPEVPVPCQFASFGCSEQVPKKEMETHLMNHMAKHLELVASYVRTVPSVPQSVETSGSMDYFEPTSRRHLFSKPPASAGKNIEVQEYGAKKLNSDMLGRTRMGKPSQIEPASPLVPVAAPHASFGPWQSRDLLEQMQILKDKVRSLEEKEVMLGQRVIELESKNKSKEHEIRSLKGKVEQARTEIKDIQEHSANGVFVWRLHGYSRLCYAAERGEPTVRHSDGFYTSSCGYRLCIRVNINKSEGLAGVGYISLFVHFMQGKYDDLLEWPFRGSITLSIIDQNEDGSKRKDIKEMLQAKSVLDAFKRPKTVRNHKGFGYMEFASIDSLERNSNFVKNDVLLIKVEVQPHS
ncbi:TNF receptor-associated factor 6-like [Diadema setosum]|uniref:TNF receptor-associated factor 6-like n=1 Tax=Diadema setosum TaxID=31175 RepID=UPI003B3AD7B8